VFTHLAQALSSHPPSAFAIALFKALHAEAADASPESRALLHAIQAACQCLLIRTAPATHGERLARSALQAIAALLHPGSSGPERTGLPWGGEGKNPITSSEAAQHQGAVTGVREAVRHALRSTMAEVSSCAPGIGEVDDAVLALLWELRTTPGGERLDVSALKVLVGLVCSSMPAAKRFAGLRAVGESLAVDASIGPGAALAAVEATCAGAADHNPTAAWPGVGLLLAVLIASLRPCGELPYTSIAVVEAPVDVAPIPTWCSTVVAQGLLGRLHPVVTRPPETALPTLCACYALELLSSICMALLHQGHGTSAAAMQARQDVYHLMPALGSAADSILGVVVGSRVGRQCIEDARRAEGAFHGPLLRGPLDGVLGIAAVQVFLDGRGHCPDNPQDSLAWRIMRCVVRTEGELKA